MATVIARWKKIIAVMSALVLLGGYVAWRSHWFDRQPMSSSKLKQIMITCSGSELMPGSKRQEVVRPSDVTLPARQNQP